jgi:probable F420-dependent oxidoreductase
MGRVGVWSGDLRFGPDLGAIAEAAAELDELGFGAIWFPGGVGGDVLADIDRLLSATKRAVIATGIINIWRHEPSDIGRWWKGLSEDRKARVMLGLGVSHGPLIGEAYGKPLAVMTEFLDKLDAEGVPAQSRCIAALAPKMLDLAKRRSAGTHPYLVPPEHSEIARRSVGPGALVAPEQGVVLETDPARAREAAAKALKIYMGLPNYVNNWRRLGFGDADVTGPSDRLLDALFAWGDAAKIAERVKAHHAAGADHVCVQVIQADPAAGLAGLRQSWRTLAKALI